MINNKIINNICEKVITGYDLTEEVLNKLGINQEDIKILLQNNIIEYNSNGTFNLKGVNSLYNYGKKLLAMKEIEKAQICFNKCIEIDSNHYASHIQIFINSVNNKDYKKTFEVIDKLFSISNNYRKTNINYYLYLLNKITQLPEKYKEYIKNIKLDDIKIPQTTNDIKDVSKRNEIRKKVFQGRLTLALKKIKELDYSNFTAVEVAERTLIYLSIREKEKFRNNLQKLMEEYKYDEIVENLNSAKDRYSLNSYEQYILLICEKINEINNGQKLLPQVMNGISLEEAINTNNFDVALSFDSIYNSKKEIDQEKNLVHLLLIQICNLMRNFNQNEYLNMDCYIKDFYVELFKSNFDKAKLYLSIISKFSDKNFVETLIKVLDVHYRKSILIPYISEKHDWILNNGGIALLKPMDEEDIKIACDFISHYSSIESFIIGDENRQIVLRYKISSNKNLNLKTFQINGDIAYKNGDYDKCIDNYLKILYSISEPNSVVYSKLGLAYLKNNQKSLSIEYLKVANYLFKQKNINRDFTLLIRKLNDQLLLKDSNNDNNYQKTLEK